MEFTHLIKLQFKANVLKVVVRKIHLQGSCDSKHTDAENMGTVSSFTPE